MQKSNKKTTNDDIHINQMKFIEKRMKILILNPTQLIEPIQWNSSKRVEARYMTLT